MAKKSDTINLTVVDDISDEGVDFNNIESDDEESIGLEEVMQLQLLKNF